MQFTAMHWERSSSSEATLLSDMHIETSHCNFDRDGVTISISGQESSRRLPDSGGSTLVQEFSIDDLFVSSRSHLQLVICIKISAIHQTLTCLSEI